MYLYCRKETTSVLGGVCVAIVSSESTPLCVCCRGNHYIFILNMIKANIPLYMNKSIL
jgi:hypothetical protein